MDNFRWCADVQRLKYIRSRPTVRWNTEKNRACIVLHPHSTFPRAKIIIIPLFSGYDVRMQIVRIVDRNPVINTSENH